MSIEHLSDKYWEQRYSDGNTGWDLGAPSPPLKHFIDSLEDKSTSILIPGAGNAYEAEYLHSLGFEQIDVIDLAQSPLENLKTRMPTFPEAHLINKNFFSHQGSYDLILEQTFFCAIDPKLRTLYVSQMYDLLKPTGMLAGLLFDIPLNEDKPPYGGSKEVYQNLFETSFEIDYMETTPLSVIPRAGNELFFIAKPKKK